MSLVSFIITNWQLIIAVLVAATGAITWLYKFFQLSPEERRGEIKAILVSLAYKAEEELGAKTGSIKRSQVYNLFKKNYPFLASITSMATFDKILDDALDVVREALDMKEEG